MLLSRRRRRSLSRAAADASCRIQRSTSACIDSVLICHKCPRQRPRNARGACIFNATSSSNSQRRTERNANGALFFFQLQETPPTMWAQSREGHIFLKHDGAQTHHSSSVNFMYDWKISCFQKIYIMDIYQRRR